MKIAKQNIQNAQSVLSIVEAGQQKSIELLQNMREKMLRVQDSTLTTDQRQSLLDQLNELKSELQIFIILLNGIVLNISRYYRYFPSWRRIW